MDDHTKPLEKQDNDNNVLADGKDYTMMEHKWDEGFGYLYGQEADVTRLDLGTSPTGNGTTLNKYFKKLLLKNKEKLLQKFKIENPNPQSRSPIPFQSPNLQSQSQS